MVKEEFFSTLDLFKKGIAKTNGDNTLQGTLNKLFIVF